MHVYETLAPGAAFSRAQGGICAALDIFQSSFMSIDLLGFHNDPVRYRHFHLTASRMRRREGFPPRSKA